MVYWTHLLSLSTSLQKVREWIIEPKIFNYPVCWHYFICTTDIKSLHHSISITELRTTPLNVTFVLLVVASVLFSTLPHPPSDFFNSKALCGTQKYLSVECPYFREVPELCLSRVLFSSTHLVTYGWILACAQHGSILGLAGALCHIFIIDINEILLVSIIDISGEGRERLVRFFSPSFLYRFNFPCYILTLSGQSNESLISAGLSGLWPFTWFNVDTVTC